LGAGQVIQEASRFHCNSLSYTVLSSSYEQVELVLSASHRDSFYHVSSEEVSQAIEQYNTLSDMIFSWYALW